MAFNPTQAVPAGSLAPLRALNVGVFIGWLVLFVAAAVKLVASGGGDQAAPLWSVPVVSALSVGLELLCSAEVARLLVGRLRATGRGTAIVGLPHHLSGRNVLTRLLHTRLIVCLLIFPLLLDHTPGINSLYGNY